MRNRSSHLMNMGKLAYLALMPALFAGCGGGGSDPVTTAAVQIISGGGVKGPLTSANVAIYPLNFAAAVTIGSTAIDIGTTNAQAKIQDLSLPFPLAPPYILEFTATASTKDLATCTDPADSSTCFAPIITTMRTVITSAMLTSGQKIYATPLTTMAVNIALRNAVDTDVSGTIEATEFLAAVSTAGKQVASTLGFGMGRTVDIFNTPPLINDATDTTEKQAATAGYRAAIEALGAVVAQMDQQAVGDSDALFNELADDLADGTLDGTLKSSGTASTIFTSTTLSVLQQDPSNLTIPNTTIKVGDIEAVLAAEAISTGTTVNTAALTDGISIVVVTAPAKTNPDSDADGILNIDDAFPEDATADTDTDGDGAPDVAYTDASRTTIDVSRSDADDDDDGWLDTEDDYATDATRFLNPLLDRDSDTVANGVDNCPLTSNRDQADADGNGRGDVCSSDSDGDGVDDGSDNCPVNANPAQIDTDSDGTGDVCDINIDGDAEDNATDAFPLDSTETVDTDGDGIGNNADTDDDGDGLSDTDEGIAGTNPLVMDSDGDGYLDGVDLDPLDNTVTVNTAPLATSQSGTVAEDGSLPITLSVADPDAADSAGAMSYTVGSATNGTATNNSDGTVTYIPAANYSGSDSFTYSVTDTSGATSNTATVTITVTAVNDAPVIAEGATATVNMDEDGSPTTFSLTLNATDTESDTITWSISSVATNGAATATGTGISKAIGYTPTANWSGSDSFDVQITDGTATDTITVTVNVAAVNDAPVITEGATATVNMDEDGSPTAFSLTLNATDIESDTITWSISGAATNGTAIATGTGISKAIGYTPTANWSGTDSFDVQITDGTLTDTITVTVIVAAVNDAPVITEGATATVNMDEDGSPTAFSLTLNATDTESDTITWSISGAATNGTAIATGTGISKAIGYTPTANWSGSDSFDLQITDGTAIDTITVTVNVAAVNDVPNAVDDAVGVLVDSSSNSIDVLANDGDVEGSALTITAVDNPSTQSGTVTTDGSTVTYTPAASYSGSDTFTYTVSDGTDSSVATVTVMVSTNQSPVITEGATTTVDMDEDGTPTAFLLTLNATDAESDTITWSISGAATNGTATASGTGTSKAIGYTPTANWNGTDSFIVQASDGASSDTITVTVNVAAQNDAPVISEGATTTINMDEDGAPTAFSLTLNATDVDSGDTITWTISSVASNGVASATGTGTSKVIGYSPDANFNGADSFDVQISDGTVTDTITVTVNVAAQNDAPTISGTAPAATVGSAYSFTPTSGDVDSGDTLTFSCTGCPTGWTGYNFNTATGEISGTPTSAGTVSGITITVGDGTTTTDLGPFDITTNTTGAVWGSFNWDSENWQ